MLPVQKGNTSSSTPTRGSREAVHQNHGFNMLQLKAHRNSLSEAVIKYDQMCCPFFASEFQFPYNFNDDQIFPTILTHQFSYLWGFCIAPKPTPWAATHVVSSECWWHRRTLPRCWDSPCGGQSNGTTAVLKMFPLDGGYRYAHFISIS